MTVEALQALEEARRRILTPQWMRDLTVDLRIAQMENDQVLATLGVTLALLDYCRQHMETQDWLYVQSSLSKALERSVPVTAELEVEQSYNDTQLFNESTSQQTRWA